jgi:hypothetical protein
VENKDQLDLIKQVDDVMKVFLPQIAEFIENYDSNTVYETDFRPDQKSFGLTRIEAIKFMRTIIKLGNVEYAVYFT